MRWLKRKILRWLLDEELLREIEIPVLRVKHLDPQYVDWARLTADPALAPGRVWCFPRGEIIPCNLHPKRVEELYESYTQDLILRHDGSGFQRIVKMGRQHYRGKIYEIKPYNLLSFRVTPEHPILVIKSRKSVDAKGYMRYAHHKPYYNPNNPIVTARRPQWVLPHEVERGDILLIPRIKMFDKELNRRFSERLLLILGAYIAEGSVEKYKVRFYFGRHEEDFVKYLANALRKVLKTLDVKAAVHVHKTERSIYIDVYSKMFAELVAKYCGTNSYNKYIHPDLLKLSPNKLKYLLRGLVIGDGSIINGGLVKYLLRGRIRDRAKVLEQLRGREVCVVTTSLPLVYSLILVLTKFGVIPSITVRESKSVYIEGHVANTREAYYVRFPAIVLVEKVKTGIGHKYLKFRHYWYDRNYIYVQVEYVRELDYEGEIYHMETEDGTIPIPVITHNSRDVAPYFRFSPDGTTVRSMDVDYHKSLSPIDHPDGSVTPAKMAFGDYSTKICALGYHKGGVAIETTASITYYPPAPTKGVPLPCICFCTSYNAYVYFNVPTVVDGFISAFNKASNYGRVMNRFDPVNKNGYLACLEIPGTTADWKIYKLSAGSWTQLAYEAVDLTAADRVLVLRCVGSTIEGAYKESATLSTTDTAFTSGIVAYGSYSECQTFGFGWVGYYSPPPYTRSLETLVIIEADVIGDGTYENAFRPALRHDVTPDGTKDLDAITWGAIDFRSGPATGKPIAPTFLICVYSDNPYKPGAIQRQIDFARSKGKKVYTPPFDELKIKDIHQAERKDRDWLISEEELMYQITGREDLEPIAVLRFYEREVLDLRRIDPAKIPDFDEAMEMWAKRAEQHGKYDVAKRFRELKRK